MVFCWGSGNQGQLGLGTEGENMPVPHMIAELDDVEMEQIEAFHEKSAAITKDGQLVVWGRTRDGSMVDGNGKTYSTNLSIPTLFEEKNCATFKQVSCGKDHIAAVTADGKLLTLGNPEHGKLGHTIETSESKEQAGMFSGVVGSKTVASNYKPKGISDMSKIDYVNVIDCTEGEDVSKLQSKKVKQVSCGFRHTACVTEDGELYTWGAGKNG